MAGCESAQLVGLVPTSPTVRVQSIDEDPVVITGRFPTSFYSHVGGVEATYLLADASLDALLDGEIQNGQILHVELLWDPLPGQTPMNPAVTNASIRYIVIAKGELGVYGGSGFVLPKGTIGGDRSAVTIVNASLKLLESTGGFNDLLTPARMSGTISAKLDARSAQSLQFAASQLVTNALGVSRFVCAPDAPTKTATVRVAATNDRNVPYDARP